MQLPWQPLFSIYRSKKLELTLYGIIAVVQLDSQKQSSVLSVGDINESIWTRSILKYVQLAANYEILRNKYNFLTNTNFAIMMASHSAQDIHLKQLNDIIQNSNLNQNWLKCPVTKNKHYNPDSSSLYHNCSGKHLQYLLVSQALNQDVSNYLDNNNIIYDNLKNFLTKFILNFKSDATIDGCQIPNFAMSIVDCALLYANIATSGKYLNEKLSDYRPIFNDLTKIMIDNPYLIGGRDRLDSTIMAKNNTSQLTLVAKEGADGILCCGLNNYGIIIKLSSGFNKNYMQLLLNEIFSRIGYNSIVIDESAKSQEHITHQFHF